MAYPDTPVNIVEQTPLGPYHSLPLAALDLAVVLTACDATEGNQFSGTGQQILLLLNCGASARVVTFTSVPEGSTLRPGDITAYSIPAAVAGVPGVAMYSFAKSIAPKGWSLGGLATGKVRFLAAHADVKAVVIGPVIAQNA